MKGEILGESPSGSDERQLDHAGWVTNFDSTARRGCINCLVCPGGICVSVKHVVCR